MLGTVQLSPAGLTRRVLAAYLLLAGLSSLSVGKLGSEVNHLIELMGVVCACSAIAVAEALYPPGGGQSSAWAAFAALLVPVLLLWQVVRIAPPETIEVIELPTAVQQTRLAQLVDAVRRVDGPVLSEDLTLLSLAGQPVRFQPFDATQLIYRHLRDEAPLIAALARGEFRLVVLRFDVGHAPPLAYDRFTPAMIEAIRRDYRLRATFPGYWLYTPASRESQEVGA